MRTVIICYCLSGSDVPQSNYGKETPSVCLRFVYHQQATNHIGKCNWLLVSLWEVCKVRGLSGRAHCIKYGAYNIIECSLFQAFSLKYRDGKKAIIMCVNIRN
jgi:hypothetical protein